MEKATRVIDGEVFRLGIRPRLADWTKGTRQRCQSCGAAPDDRHGPFCRAAAR